MKIYKVIVGILLFAAPIAFHFGGTYYYMMHAPIGTLATPSGNVRFSLHNFQLYTSDGQVIFAGNIDNHAENDMYGYFTEIVGLERVLSLEGIMTIIILWGLAFYAISSIIDQKVLNLISDIVMIGFAVISLVAFLSWNERIPITTDFGIPIFTIISGLLGIGGLIHSSMELKK